MGSSKFKLQKPFGHGDFSHSILFSIWNFYSSVIARHIPLMSLRGSSSLDGRRSNLIPRRDCRASLAMTPGEGLAMAMRTVATTPPFAIVRQTRLLSLRGMASFCSTTLKGRAHEAKASHYIFEQPYRCAAHLVPVIASHPPLSLRGTLVTKQSRY